MSAEPPPPTDHVDRLGGRTVHWLRDRGEPPTVLLLGGCGVPSYRWDAVVEQLTGIDVVRLDRPGIGTPWPGVLPRLSDEVATLLDLAGRLPAPVVVVAHSMAGLHAEALARRHPEVVAGLVLVDGSVESEPRRPAAPRLWLAAARAARRAMSVRALQPLGSLADRVMTASQSGRSLLSTAPEEAVRTYRDPETIASVVAEQAAYAQQVWDLAELRRTHELPALPVVVLTATGDGGPDWVEEQRKLATLLAARQVVVETSRHLMMIDAPEVVAEAVRSVRPRSPGTT